MRMTPAQTRAKAQEMLDFARTHYAEACKGKPNICLGALPGGEVEELMNFPALVQFLEEVANSTDEEILLNQAGMHEA